MKTIPDGTQIYQHLVASLSQHYQKPIEEVSTQLPYHSLAHSQAVAVTEYQYGEHRWYLDRSGQVYGGVSNKIKTHDGETLLGKSLD